MTQPQTNRDFGEDPRPDPTFRRHGPEPPENDAGPSRPGEVGRDGSEGQGDETSGTGKHE
jgi:hypothetical protein